MATSKPVTQIDSAVTTPDYRDFYAAARSCFVTASNNADTTPALWLNLAGSALRLRFAGEAMVANVTPALEHLLIDPQSQSDLDVCIWDSVSTQAPMPPPPWGSHDYVARGEIRNHRGQGGIDLAYNPGSGRLTILHGDSQTALQWTQDADHCPYWEQAAPLRSLFHWWCSRRSQQLVHGAAVGTEAGAVLLTGKGGSGKSTTALGALLSGLDYLGDDYVLCELVGDQAKVYSLFNTAKIDDQSLEYMPEFQDKLSNNKRLPEEKAVVFIQRYFPQQMCRSRPLRAILIPRVTGNANSRIVPLRPALAYLALSPTTVFQLPGAREESLAILKQLVQRLPCYQLELGRDRQQTAALIKQTIEE